MTRVERVPSNGSLCNQNPDEVFVTEGYGLDQLAVVSIKFLLTRARQDTTDRLTVDKLHSSINYIVVVVVVIAGR